MQRQAKFYCKSQAEKQRIVNSLKCIGNTDRYLVNRLSDEITAWIDQATAEG